MKTDSIAFYILMTMFEYLPVDFQSVYILLALVQDWEGISEFRVVVVAF